MKTDDWILYRLFNRWSWFRRESKPKPTWLNPRLVGPDFKPSMSDTTTGNIIRISMANASPYRRNWEGRK